MIQSHSPLPLNSFYFIRHGETDWNRQNIVMGSKDIPLNARGREQAFEASTLLENESFDIIISSPRKRAQQTAEIISERANKPLLFEQDLVERMWGEAEGKPYDPTKSLFDDAHTPKGAETFTSFQKRVVKAVTLILLMEKVPLLVSHGGVFKALAHYIGYKDLSSSNCTPFLFKPPLNPAHPWAISSLGLEELQNAEISF